MRFVRAAKADGSSHYGRLVEEKVHLLDGPPWGSGQATGEVVRLGEMRLLAPVEPSKVVGVGRNYLDHIEEMGYDVPTEPSVFLKPPTTVIGPGAAVTLPPLDVSDEVEHEAELGVVIGRQARQVSVADAMDHVFGYTCADDVSARDLQRNDSSLARGKGWDAFCPTGPWIETELPTGGVAIRCRVNGATRQDGSTSSLVFGIPFLISYVSQFMTLQPGDLMITGSPGGSGRLEDGDEVEIEIEGIGVLIHRVQAHRPPEPAQS